MKIQWKLMQLPVLLAMFAAAGCAPLAPKSEQLPGRSHDPGRFEEAAAESAPTKREENEHRARANAKRMMEFETDCNIVSFLFGLVVKDQVCVGPVRTQNEVKAQLL
jgi:hypothetical protein